MNKDPNAVVRATKAYLDSYGILHVLPEDMKTEEGVFYVDIPKEAEIYRKYQSPALKQSNGNDYDYFTIYSLDNIYKNGNETNGDSNKVSLEKYPELFKLAQTLYNK